MKKIISYFLAVGSLAMISLTTGADPIEVVNTSPFAQKPIPVFLEGFSGEAASVLNFDLTVQGFKVVTPDQAQFTISGSNGGNVAGSLTDNFAHKMLFSRTYNGASLRRQAHAFADDIVGAIRDTKPIGGTKIAYKAQAQGGNGEIYVADFDGFDAQPVTSDGAIVAHPAWVPGRMAIYYTSYARTAAGDRRLFGLEYQCGRLPERLQGGDDLEQSRQSQRMGVRRRRLESQTPDHRRRRFLPVLVAGRQLDLLCGQGP